MLTLIVAGLILLSPVIPQSARRSTQPTEANAMLAVTPQGAWSFSGFAWSNTAPYPSGVSASGMYSGGAYYQWVDAQRVSRHTSAVYASAIGATFTASLPQSSLTFRVSNFTYLQGWSFYSVAKAKSFYYFDASETGGSGSNLSISGIDEDGETVGGNAEITFDTPASTYVLNTVKQHFYLSVDAHID